MIRHIQGTELASLSCKASSLSKMLRWPVLFVTMINITGSCTSSESEWFTGDTPNFTILHQAGAPEEKSVPGSAGLTQTDLYKRRRWPDDEYFGFYTNTNKCHEEPKAFAVVDFEDFSRWCKLTFMDLPEGILP